jgi:hypothetical protein
VIKLDVKGAVNPEKLAKLRAALEPAATDPVVERVALRAFAKVVKDTPKRWFGQVRMSWQIQKPRPGARVVVNDNKIMLWLEEGTANAGTGRIYPKRGKFLYIPRNRNAALGWNPGLVYGRDYILRKSVRGIKPRRIAAKVAKEADKWLLADMKAHIKKALA